VGARWVQTKPRTETIWRGFFMRTTKPQGMVSWRGILRNLRKTWLDLKSDQAEALPGESGLTSEFRGFDYGRNSYEVGLVRISSRPTTKIS